ncbi:unnamed protein product, partial [marine sediment metagenome]
RLLLMTIESSFIPFPSEVIVPPAAYLAQQGQMNIVLVVLAGIVGSLLGALINYCLALTLGRKIVYALVNKKFFKFLLITPEKVDKAEKYFLKYGNISTLVGRLVPWVRQLISVPAGFSKMRLSSFIFYTSLGSSIWVVILAILGYGIGSNQEQVEKYCSEISLFFVILITILIIGFVIRKNKKIKY